MSIRALFGLSVLLRLVSSCVFAKLYLWPCLRSTQEGKSRWTAVNVKRLLLPRQSRAITHFIYAYGGFGQR